MPLGSASARPVPKRQVQILPPSRRRRRDAPRAEAEDPHKQRYTEYLLLVMRQAGPACSFEPEWQACRTEVDSRAWDKAFSCMTAARFEVGSIRNAWRAWQRWLDYLELAQQGSAQAYQPPPVLVHQWLAASRARGSLSFSRQVPIPR